jgi:hypothetical protein
MKTMTAQMAGPASWAIEREKQQLTGEMIEAKTQEITKKFSDLFIAFGLAVSLLADAGDALGLQALAVATKMLLADGADRCADVVQRAEILE